MLGERAIEEAIDYFGAELFKIIEQCFWRLSKPIIKNIKKIVIAILLFLRTSRGWYGRMSLSGIARCMNTKGSIKARYKRLDSHKFGYPFFAV